MSWTRPSVGGPLPSTRAAHASAFLQRKLFVFGGWDGQRILNDFYLHQTDTSTWIQPVVTGPPPSVRAGHTITAVGTSKLFVFGGGDGTVYLNDLHVFDIESMRWSQAYVKGTPPAPRSRHTTTYCASNKTLYIIGGGDESRVFNDILMLNTTTKAWTRCQTHTHNPEDSPDDDVTRPCARWGHSTTCIGKKLFVFGGHDGNYMLNDMYVLDTDTLRWRKLPANSSAPSVRAGHTATEALGKIIVFGGGDGSKIFNDLHVFNPETEMWCHPVLHDSAPTARCAHTATFDGHTNILIFGGGAGAMRFKDLIVLDIKRALENERMRTTRQKAKPKTYLDIVKHSNNNVNTRKIDKDQHDQHFPNEDSKNKEQMDKIMVEWLNEHHLARFSNVFTNENISLDILSLLTERHLETMGIKTVGDRLRILKIISKSTPVENFSQDEKEKQCS